MKGDMRSTRSMGSTEGRTTDTAHHTKSTLEETGTFEPSDDAG